MVGFLVGGKLERKLFRASGWLILRVSALQALATFSVVAGGLWLLRVPPDLALLLGAVATATDPAATMEAIRDSGKGGRFAQVLTGVVAVDDAWGLILFSVALLVIQLMAAGVADHAPLLEAAREILGAAVLGFGLGLPMALMSGRIRRGEPTLMEAVGMVMLCAGLAQVLHLSSLLACVVLGVTVANMARHHTRPFHAIEEIEWPFLALFFLFSGAYLTTEALGHAGVLLLAYLVLRVAGRVVGSGVSSLGAGSDAPLARAMGLAMLPQAGVAMAMAFQAGSLYPHLQDRLLPVVIAAMVLFELAGPVLTGRILARVSAREDQKS
jgi:Kef-type K+ transport system membrane component KefB